MDAPEISFCLPVYNAVERIERCLRAVLAQEVPSREILVVDNASTDDTAARARALLAGVPEARVVVNEKNLGRIENWNRCLDLARGRYVKFIMVNDVFLPGGAEMLLRVARVRPEAVLFCSRARHLHGVPPELEAAPDNPPTEAYDPAGALRRMARNGNDTGAPGGMMMRGDIIRREQLKFRPDIPYWSDFYFAVELAACGEVVYINGESHVFDLSAKGRYANAGLKNYYDEGAVCARALAALLPKYGGESRAGFEFLWRQYTAQSSNYQQQPLNLWKTWGLFRGAGVYRASAWRHALLYHTRQMVRRKEPLRHETGEVPGQKSRTPGQVSVIIPCYKQAQYLAQTIESVLAQEYQPMEIIVINDGSPDNTAEVAARYGGRIKYIEQKNQGLSAARNTGLRNATGEFLHFLDSDDYVLPGFYARMMAALHEHPDSAAVYCGHREVDPAGQLLWEYPPMPEPLDWFHFLLEINNWPPHTLVLRAQALKPVGGFDTTLRSCEDWDLWLRMASTGVRFAPVPGFIGVGYRKHPLAMSNNPWVMLQTGLRVIRRNARRHINCAACKICAAKGCQYMRRICFDYKLLPQLDRRLEEGGLGWYLRECGRCLLYDPASAGRGLQLLRYRKRLMVKGLLHRH